MKKNRMNMHLSSGLLIFAITNITKQFVQLPEFLHGFGIGLSIVLLSYGIYKASRDLAGAGANR